VRADLDPDAADAARAARDAWEELTDMDEDEPLNAGFQD
jgi:hypothetical protein